MLRMGEALQISEFTDQRDGGDKIDAPQSHQRGNDRLQAPLGRLNAQRRRNAFESLVGLLDRRAIFDKGDVLSRMREANLREEAFERQSPRTLSRVGLPVPQQQRFELMPSDHPRPQGILPGTRQISDRLVRLIRHHDRRQVSSAGEMRQGQSVASVSLDPIAGLSGDLGRRHELTSVAAIAQLSGQNIAARARFVDDKQFSMRPQMRQRLLDLTDPPLFLLRPDMHIAWRGDAPPEGLSGQPQSCRATSGSWEAPLAHAPRLDSHSTARTSCDCRAWRLPYDTLAGHLQVLRDLHPSRRR
jgi:hypothetical protein